VNGERLGYREERECRSGDFIQVPGAAFSFHPGSVRKMFTSCSIAPRPRFPRKFGGGRAE
jgi:hypothetical protein